MAKAKGKTKEKKGGKGLLIVIIILLLVIVVGIVGGFFLITKMMNNSGERKIVEEVMTLDESIVNLKDPSLKKYVKYTLAITYNAKNKDIVEDLNSNLYKIKDGIIVIFQNKTPQEIEGSGGVDILREEIKAKINEILGDNQIESVYFTNLLIH